MQFGSPAVVVRREAMMLERVGADVGKVVAKFCFSTQQIFKEQQHNDNNNQTENLRPNY